MVLNVVINILEARPKDCKILPPHSVCYLWIANLLHVFYIKPWNHNCIIPRTLSWGYTNNTGLNCQSLWFFWCTRQKIGFSRKAHGRIWRKVFPPIFCQFCPKSLLWGSRNSHEVPPMLGTFLRQTEICWGKEKGGKILFASCCHVFFHWI